MHANSIKLLWAAVATTALCGAVPANAADAAIAHKSAGRSVQDITAAMSYYKPDPEAVRAARARISAAPPITDSKLDLATFYRQRSAAAASLGLIEQQIADLREAYNQSKGLDNHYGIIGELSTAEANGGNRLTAIELRREQVEWARGRFSLMLIPYTVIARLYSTLGDIKGATDALSQAENAYEKAKSNPKSNWSINQFLWRYQIEYSRAYILLAEGKSKEAEQAGRLALSAWQSDTEFNKTRTEQGGGQAENTRALVSEVIEQVLANAMLQQGRVVEAEIASRETLSKVLKRTGRYSPATGRALTTLSGIISTQGRYHEAAVLAKEAVDSLSKAGVPPYSSYYGSAVKRYAEVLALDGKWAETLKQYESTAQALAAGNTPSGFTKGDLTWGMSLVKMGQAAKAIPMLERILKEKAAIFGEDHYDTAEVRAAYAMALAGAGDITRAEPEYTRAVKELLNRDANDADEEGGGAKKARRRVILLSSYIDYLQKKASQQPATAVESAAEAFRIADVIRGQSVQKALAASAARAAANTPSLAKLVRKEQDLSREIAALFYLLSDVLALPPAQQDAKAVAELRSTIDKMREERIPLKKEIATRFPEYNELVNPPPLLASNVSKLLQGKEALVSFLVSDEGEYVWAVHRDGRIAFSRLGMTRRELSDAVSKLRKALDAEASVVEEIPQFDTELAHRVYAATLKPVESIWQDADTLLIVPDGALSQLPVALLTTQPGKPGKDLNKVSFTSYRATPWLVRKVAVVQLPTVSALKTLRAVPPAKPGRLAFAGFGDPYFSKAQQVEAARQHKEDPAPVSVAEASGPTALTKREAVDVEELAQLSRLPDSREEVHAIAQAMGANPAQDVFIGAAANESAVKRMNLSNRRVIVFATHGLVPGELKGLSQPALALTSPAVVGGDGDGLLTVEEILGLKLDADWVVLSACNTASADGAGGEALSGLGRAFFYAGTRAMLVTHWPVESSAARLLTTGLFKRYVQNNGTSRAQALRESALDMIDNAQFKAPGAKQAAFVYAHPIFWAPFVLVGDGGI